MTIETIDQPDGAALEAARAIQAASRAADASAPFSEQVVLSWSPTSAEPAHHLLARTAGGLPAGYANLDATGTAEFAVAPEYRRQGYGSALLALLEQVAAESTEGRLQIWSHGDHPGARALAARTGHRVVRELLQLRRTLDADFPGPGPVQLPTGVQIRGLRPGQDDATWLALNARAFAHHPEQGRMTAPDLQARFAEPWFDPAGFLVAEQDGVMIGFHWTKVHPDDLGEVYVLGVDPARHGGGLGQALTLAGLQYLYERGLRTVLLYVEADNAPALAVYRKLGFETWATDVMYAKAATE